MRRKANKAAKKKEGAQIRPFTTFPPETMRQYANPPLSFLIKVPEDLSPEECKRLGFTKEHIPALVAMARDLSLMQLNPAARYSALSALDTVDEGFTEDDARILVPLFACKEDDYATPDELVRLLPKFKVAAIKPLEEYIANQKAPNRDFASEALENLAEQVEDEHKTQICEFFMQCLMSYTEQKPHFNAALVAALAKFKYTKAVPLIREAFYHDCVDEGHMGDYSEILLKMGAELPKDDPLIPICEHCHDPVAVCRKKTEKTRKSYAKESADIAKLSFDEEQYDLSIAKYHEAISWDDWHHLIDPPEYFKMVKAYAAIKKYSLAYEMLKMAPSVYFGLETGNYAEDYEKLKAYIKKLAKDVHRFEFKDSPQYRPSAKNLKLLKLQATSYTCHEPEADGPMRHPREFTKNNFVWRSGHKTISFLNFSNSLGNRERIHYQVDHPTAVSYHENTKELAYASHTDFKIRIDNVQTKANKNTFIGSPCPVYCVDFDENYAVTGCMRENVVRLWNRKTNEQERTLFGHYSHVVKAYISPDKKSIISASKCVLEHSLETGELLYAYEMPEEVKRTWIFDCQMNDNYVVACTQEKHVMVWSYQTKRLLHNFIEDTHGWGVVLSLYGDYLACSMAKKQIKVLNLVTGNVIFIHTKHSEIPIAIKLTQVTAPDGQATNQLLLASADPKVIVVCNLQIEMDEAPKVPLPPRVPSSIIELPDDTPVEPARSSPRASQQPMQPSKAPAGEVIHSFDVHPPGLPKKFCATCGIFGVPLSLCGRCKQIHYCSVVCQKADWINHKKVCNVK